MSYAPEPVCHLGLNPTSCNSVPHKRPDAVQAPSPHNIGDIKRTILLTRGEEEQRQQRRHDTQESFHCSIGLKYNYHPPLDAISPKSFSGVVTTFSIRYARLSRMSSFSLSKVPMSRHLHCTQTIFVRISATNIASAANLPGWVITKTASYTPGYTPPHSPAYKYFHQISDTQNVNIHPIFLI